MNPVLTSQEIGIGSFSAVSTTPNCQHNLSWTNVDCLIAVDDIAQFELP
jgi:hypothetical protein